jgi:hypothetical protein
VEIMRRATRLDRRSQDIAVLKTMTNLVALQSRDGRPDDHARASNELMDAMI